MTAPNDEELMRLVMIADDECLEEGDSPKKRSLSTVARVMNKLGFDGQPLFTKDVNSISHRAAKMFERLYRPEDIALGGIHMGAFMFRDIFVKVGVPLTFGTVRLEPFKQTNLNEAQKAWLQQRPNDLLSFYDQFTDILDFGFGLDDLTKSSSVDDDCKSFLELAHFQLQAAAAIVTGAYDFRGAI